MDLHQALAELGLSLQTDHAAAKASYRALAMHLHPDVNSGLLANSRMKAINVAYAVVCQDLDTLHSTVGRNVSATGGFTEFDLKTGFKTGAAVGPTDSAAPREALVKRTLQVNLFEAAFGCVKRISGTATGTCPRCAGSGEFSGTWTLGSPCMQCHGCGQVGQMGERLPCAACQGSGLLKPPVPDCTAN